MGLMSRRECHGGSCQSTGVMGRKSSQGCNGARARSQASQGSFQVAGVIELELNGGCHGARIKSRVSWGLCQSAVIMGSGAVGLVSSHRCHGVCVKNCGCHAGLRSSQGRHGAHVKSRVPWGLCQGQMHGACVMLRVS
jgi:hypothetical protein